jgi:hypothetical protein
MLLHDLLAVKVPRLETWAPTATGLLTSGFMFLAARGWLRRQYGVSGNQLPSDPIRAWVSERRADVRRYGNPVEVLLTDLAGGAPKRGWVLDRSLGGLRLWFPHAAATGQFLAVHRLDAPARSAWVRLQVKHCRRDQSAWMMGGCFVNASTLAGLLFV